MRYKNETGVDTNKIEIELALGLADYVVMVDGPFCRACAPFGKSAWFERQALMGGDE